MTQPRTLALCPVALAAALFTQAAVADQPLATLPYTPSLDVQAMDRSAKPCDDLYQYACGGWMARNPIPAEESFWSVYAKLARDNQRHLWGILQDLASATQRSPSQARIGDYFAACMDEEAVARAALQPVQPLLQRIAGLQDRRELPALLAELHLTHDNPRFFFTFGAAQDFADASRVIAAVGAGGLSLPERSYYLDADARARQLRQAFVAHVARLLQLGGTPESEAKQAARDILALETRLARASLSPVQRRDPKRSHNPHDAAALAALTPGFDWTAYQQGLGLAAQAQFNVSEPAFVRALNQVWQRTPLSTLRAYLRWQLLSSQAAVLGPDLAKENFAFYGKTLTGTPEPKPRWAQCVALVDQQLGEDLGQEFVARNFTPEMKAATQRMTEQIETAMAQRIQALSWMSPQTKERALQKLHAVTNKVGYPERWRDYSGYEVRRTDFQGNVARGQAFELRRNLAKIGKPLERGEWSMTPQTVNAYYDPQMNDINFPAGVLLPPLYDPRMDDAPNYGNTGGTIGHELVHAFDDEGRQFDGQGNLRDWWQPRDAKTFKQRAACVTQQYAQYTVVDDIKINSQLTLGEDLADLGGLVLAWAAWQAQVAELSAQGKAPQAQDGLTPEQRFFVGFAQWDCNHARPEAERLHAKTNPHSPGRYRINGVVVNMPEFQKAFGCKAGDKLVKPQGQRCEVW
ncbi:M13 family metallopeptidase [Roseateles sp. BYS180W]|uniref:M13 family metallopeptidase n=1 Tax=Roseateles rivi TaxID=3299028 RepID=A0ABW7FU29_9BURK